MPFKKVLNHDEQKTPSRLYIHNLGYDKVFSGYWQHAENYGLEAANDVALMRSNIAFVLGTVWGDTNTLEPVVDLLLFSDIDARKFPANPDVGLVVVRSGIWQAVANTCDDTLVMAGFEAAYRRSKGQTLDNYLAKPPNINALNRQLNPNPLTMR